MKVAVTQLSWFSAAGLRFRASSSIARSFLVLGLDSVPIATLPAERSGECKTSVIEELDLITKVLGGERPQRCRASPCELVARVFNRKGPGELPQRSQTRPRL